MHTWQSRWWDRRCWMLMHTCGVNQFTPQNGGRKDSHCITGMAPCSLLKTRSGGLTTMMGELVVSCKRARVLVGKTKGKVEATESSFQTSCFPSHKLHSSSSSIHSPIAMVLFHLITPLPVEDKAVQSWLTRTRLVEFQDCHGLQCLFIHWHRTSWCSLQEGARS